MERLIDSETAKVLNEHLGNEMTRDVDIQVYASGNDDFSKFTAQFVKELSEISDKIKPEFLDGTAGKDKGFPTDPTLVIGEKLGYNIRFNGTPAGHEATSLIEIIKTVSRGESGLTPESSQKLKSLNKPVLLQVFVTPSCPYCPLSAVMSAKIAVDNPAVITAEIIEAEENKELSLKYNVTSVPQQLINRDAASVSIGVQPEAKLVSDLLKFGM